MHFSMQLRQDCRGNSCLALCIICLSPLVIIMLCMDSCVGSAIQLDDETGGCAELGTHEGMLAASCNKVSQFTLF